MRLTGEKFGYARFSSDSQDYNYQINELKKQGNNEALILQIRSQKKILIEKNIKGLKQS